MIVIDATNQIVGRMASHAAKTALLGEQVHVINCEKAVFSGDAVLVKRKYEYNANHRGTPRKGPFLIRRSDMFVKRIIRGMIPWHREHGYTALKNVRCYIGAPAELAAKDKTTYKDADVSKLPFRKFVSVGEVVKHMGGSQ